MTPTITAVVRMYANNSLTIVQLKLDKLFTMFTISVIFSLDPVACGEYNLTS